MRTFARSNMTGGVALIGASVIALSPIVATPQQVHLPAIPVSSIATTLTASANPINEWVQVLTTAFNNLSALGQQVQADPAPILKQIIANQIGYANTVRTALGAAGDSFVTAVGALPPAFRQAAQELAAGQISGGLSTAFQAVLNLLINPGLALMSSPILGIPGQVLQNLTNVVKLVPDLVVGLGFSALGTVGGVQKAFVDTAQAVYDAVRAGNFGAVVNTIVNAPAVLTNAFLNGYAPEAGSWGILSAGVGLVPVLVTAVRNAIAQALGAPVPAAAAAASPDPGPSAVPSAASPVVSLTVGVEKVTTPDPAKVAATEIAPAEPAATAPAATEPAATEPTAAAPAATSPETSSPATETTPGSGTTAGSTTAPNGGTEATSGTETGTPGKTGEPTEAGGSAGSGTGSGGTTTANGGTEATSGTKTGRPGKTGEPTKAGGSTGSGTGSGSTTTANGGTEATSGTKTGTPGKTGESTKSSGSTAGGTGSGSTGAGSGASGSGSGASASGGGASQAAA